MMKMNLSEKQRQIVEFRDGALLVEAGPGSGKTRVLIERIKHLINNSKRVKVLALTFSNMAADEMKTRLNEDYSFEDNVNRVSVGTIHSFCLDLVQSRGNLIGLNPNIVLFENEDDKKTILKDAFLNNHELELFLSTRKNKQKILQRALQLIAERKKNFILPENCTDNYPFPLIYSEYNKKLIEQNAMDFDDILFFAFRILVENPRVVRMYNSLYKYICIDESQDLNFAQYQVIKALCGEIFKNIMFVGDANQSIYGFNGSSSIYMSRNFVEDFKPTKFVLNENYRSAKRIVEFANQLEHYDSTANYVYDGELCAYGFDDEESEAKYIVDKIKQLIRDGHPDVEGAITDNKIAIIGRNKYVFNRLEQELANKNLPFHFKKTSSGIENESNLIRIFDLSIRILINPKDYIHLNQLKAIVGSADNCLFSNNNGINIIKNTLESTKYSIIIPALEKLDKEMMNFGGSLNILQDLIPSFKDEERYLISMDIDQWRSHWNKYCMLIPKENRTLTSFRNLISIGKTSVANDSTGISLLTAHMSKGLQYDVVFIMGLCEGVFPDYRAISAGEDQLAQEKNNMYVAVTRAKRLCYMTYPRKKMMPWGDIKFQTPSRYITDIL